MIRGISLAQHLLPCNIVEQHNLTARLFDRGGEVEYQFLWNTKHRVLPVLVGNTHEGIELRLVTWGCRRGEGRLLPYTRGASLESVRAGRWEQFNSAPVDIPCSLFLENGVWVSTKQGMRGLLVKDEAGVERAYVLCEPSSHYYRIMTRSDWMPVLIDETI